MGRRRLVAAAAAAVLAVAATYFTVTLTYGIEHGGFGSDPGAQPLATGTRVRVGVSVRNPGRLPIVLDAVTFESADIAVDEVTVIPGPESCCSPQQAVPFHSVGVGTHDEAVVFLLLRVTNADDYVPCSYLALTSASVRYRVLGMSRSERITLLTPFEFRAACT